MFLMELWISLLLLLLLLYGSETWTLKKPDEAITTAAERKF
jgi:hypothetical protein